MSGKLRLIFIGMGGAFCIAPALAADFNFDTGVGPLHAAWATTLTVGAGVRVKNPSCALTGDPNANNCGLAANTAQWANGDDGDLNYKKGQFFTAYGSATSELLLALPASGWKGLIRGTGLYDAGANNTDRTALSGEARAYVVSRLQLLDLWVEKDFELGERQAHLRVGNQVINWGESYFASGGINATNSIDIQKLLTPGTQLKQALLPAPMLEFASGLPNGFSTEAYLQWKWNENRYPPVGTYFSVSDVYRRGAQPGSFNTSNFNVSGNDAATFAGPGASSTAVLNAANAALLAGSYAGAIGVPYKTNNPTDAPEFGWRMGYAPSGQNASYAVYYENYTDKSPVLTYFNYASSAQFDFLKRRQLFGASANFSVGDWAIGSELSYRPKDATSLSLCYLAGGPADANTNLANGECKSYKDYKKYQFDINAQISLTQSSFPLLAAVNAQQAYFTAEFTYVKYPGIGSNKAISSTIDGQAVYQLPAAGYFPWLKNDSSFGYQIAAGSGTSDSAGLALDFNMTYDGNVIPGWAVTPGVTFYDALRGYTPTFSANYMQGAKSANFYLLFNQNPSVWQAGLNMTLYYGGNQLSQPYSDRNFVGAYVSRNF